MSGTKEKNFTYTGSAFLKSPFYEGKVTALLDVYDGTITVYVPQIFKSISETNKKSEVFEEEARQLHVLHDVSFLLPLGRLKRQVLDGLELRSLQMGTISVHNTALSAVFELRKMTGLSSITYVSSSGGIDFDIEPPGEGSSELIFSSGHLEIMPLHGVSGQWNIAADQNFTHFNSTSEAQCQFDMLQIIWTLLGGTYIHPFLTRFGNTLTVYGYRKPAISNFPLIAVTYMGERQQENVRRGFEAIYEYCCDMSPEQFSFWKVSCSYLINAKSQGLPIDSGVLNIYTYLEASDRCRTMNWQSIKSLLGVTRSEAEFIVNVRNSFAHGRLSLLGAIEQYRAHITASDVFQGLRSSYPDIEFFFLMLQLVDRYLCGTFGIESNAERYAIPIAGIRSKE